MDIVPTKVQWEAFSNPASGVNYWHWPFLANVQIASELIDAYGGDKFCKYQLTRIQGPDAEGQKRFMADGAHDVYAELFKKKETLIGTCEDYASGAAPEASEQAEGQNAGRKLEIPTLVLFSAMMIGSKLEVAGIWKDWVAEETNLRAVGIKKYGHYLPEEGPDDIVQELKDWIEKL